MIWAILLALCPWTTPIRPLSIPAPGLVHPHLEGYRQYGYYYGITTNYYTSRYRGPAVNIPELADTVSCEFSSLMADVNPLRFDIWVNSARVALATMATDNCSGIDNIVDDAPSSLKIIAEALRLPLPLLTIAGQLLIGSRPSLQSTPFHRYSLAYQTIP